MPREEVAVPGAFKAGPYSSGVWAGDLLYLSGQTPTDASGKLVEGDIGMQTQACFKKLFAILEAAGLTPDDVIKCNVFLVNIADFSAMNAVYGQQFKAPYPARTTIGVAALPLGAQIEIEMIAKR